MQGWSLIQYLTCIFIYLLEDVCPTFFKHFCVHPEQAQWVDSLLGSQYIFNVGFGHPTLGDSDLKTQQHLSNLHTAFFSLLWLLFEALDFFSQPFNDLFSFLVSHIYSPKLVEKIMITLMASGRGGPMLLLLSGHLVGSGVWWGWHWNWFPLLGGGRGEMSGSGIS